MRTHIVHVCADGRVGALSAAAREKKTGQLRREAAAPKSNPTSISTALAHTKKSLRQPVLRLPLAADNRITPAVAQHGSAAAHVVRWYARHGAPKSSPVRAVSASAERVWVRTLRAAENSEGRTVE